MAPPCFIGWNSVKVNPVELEMASVSIEELKSSEDKSYKSLFNKSRMIDSSSKSILTGIYDFNAVGKDFPRQLLDADWNECCRQFRSRYVIISIKNDYVFVPLKLHQVPYRSWYYTITMKPVSVNNRLENELSVIQVLSDYCIDGVVIGEDKEENAVDNNYYNTAEDFHSWMDKCKWRSKHGIKKLSSLIEFRNEWYDGAESDIIECGTEWVRQKKLLGLQPKSIKNAELFAKRRKSPFFYSFFYKGKMIGYMLPSVFEKCAMIEVSHSIASNIDYCKDVLGFNEQNANLAFKQFGRYMQYKMHKDFFDAKNFDAVYYCSDIGWAGLKDFKTMNFRRKFWYNQYSMKEYINMLETKIKRLSSSES